MRRSVLSVLALPIVFSTSACAGGGDEAGSADQQVVSSQPSEVSETAPTDFVRLPVVSEVFEDAVWGQQLTPQQEPLVTGSRLVWVEGTDLVAVDSAGVEAWRVPIEFLGDPAEIKAQTGDADTDMVVRLADRETVAVIEAGKREGSGLDAAIYVQRVTLIDLASGDEVEQVDIEGSESDRPNLAVFGLAFPGGNGMDSYTVAPDGAVSVSGEGAVPVATVGTHIITTEGGGESDTVVDLPATDATLQGVDADHTALLRTYDQEADSEAFSWLDLRTDEVVATGPCGPATANLLPTSPNGTYAVAGNAFYNIKTQDVTCVGGGEGERYVSFDAVDDQGRGIGQTRDTGQDPLLVIADAQGEPQSFPMSEAESRPRVIGIMDGRLVVHWDSNAGVVNGNPLVLE